MGWIPVVLSGVMLGYYIDWKDGGSVFGRDAAEEIAERTKLLGVSEEEIRRDDERKEREKEITIELVENFALPPGKDEPLPPWIEVPGVDPYHMIWRMGAEGYLRDEFFPFFDKLDRDQREEYFARYDLGEDWPVRGSWYNNLLPPCDEDVSGDVN
ncbi:MAG: hypothetical protein ACR2RD_13710 [Woeseiaceae bacterium]